MKRVCLVLAFVVALSCAASAQIGGLMFPGPGVPQASAGGCSQATAFLARNGNVHPTETTTLICGLVSATYSGGGTMFSHLDFLHVATDTAAHYNLNLISTSFTLTQVGAPSFPTYTANVGYTGSNSSGALSTNFTPSTAGGNFQQNSASLGVCISNSRTTPDSSTIIGANDTSTTFTQLAPLQSSGYFFDINDITFPHLSGVTTTQGLSAASRTGALAAALYQGVSSTAAQTSTAASISNTSFALYLLATDQSGTVANPSSDTVSADFAGAALTGADYATIATLIHNYLVAIGVSGC